MCSLATAQTHLSQWSSFKSPKFVFLPSSAHLFLIWWFLILLCKHISVGIDGEVHCKGDE